MNSFLISAITLCVAAQCAIAQYQSGSGGYGAGGYQQRKMAPSPQTYGQQGGYGGEQQQYESMGGYEQAAPAYRAPSSAAVSQYDERAPAGGYGGKSAGSSYGRQQSAGYGAQQAASSYAKPAARYEEPYIISRTPLSGLTDVDSGKVDLLTPGADPYRKHPPMPFAWGYDINDGYGGAQYHKENGDEYGKRTGSYGYTDAYGIYRQVDYVADEHGFRATIKTNEPGTANESPADVELHAYEPPSNYYAGNTNSYSQAPAKSYGAASSGSSYGSSGSSYGNSGSSYGAASSSSYSAPRAAPQQAYGGAQRSGYSTKQQGGGYGGNQAMRAYEPAAQYSSSQLVPIYQKAAPAKVAAAPAKRY